MGSSDSSRRRSKYYLIGKVPYLQRASKRSIRLRNVARDAISIDEISELVGVAGQVREVEASRGAIRGLSESHDRRTGVKYSRVRESEVS